VPLAAALRLRATEVRCGWSGMSQGSWYMCQQKYSIGDALWQEKACLDCPLT
jgi:hypothetical protein